MPRRTLSYDGSEVRPHSTMAEAAAERLHQAIISGTLPAGAHLRIGELSELLQMSAIPVREALRRLEALGIVEVHPHRGAFVRPLTEEDFVDTIQTRLLIESACIERAAAKFSDEDLLRAEQCLERYSALLDAGLLVQARESHTEFHYVLYRVAGSRWLLHSLDAVWRNSERYRFAANLEESRSRTLREHREILAACHARDPDRAVKALTAHLRSAAERMAANLGFKVKSF